MAATIAKLYPGGHVHAPIINAPRWAVSLIGPLMGYGRDFIRANWGPAPKFSSQKAASELGLVSLLPLEVSLHDMVEDLAAKQLLRHPRATDGACWGLWGSSRPRSKGGSEERVG